MGAVSCRAPPLPCSSGTHPLHKEQFQLNLQLSINGQGSPYQPLHPLPRPAVGWEAASRAGADPDSSDSQPRAPQGYSWPSHTAPSCCQAWYVLIGLMENKSSAPTWLRDQRRGNKVSFQTLLTSCHPGHCPLHALQRGRPACVAVGAAPQHVPANNTALGHTKPPTELQAAALCAACTTRQCPVCYWTRGGLLNWTCCSSSAPACAGPRSVPLLWGTPEVLP